MNYFELFGFPESVRIDKEKLRERYFALSRESHPDYHAQAAREGQQKALETTADINKGYRVLSDEDETIKYLLGLHGLLEEDDKSALPQDFLMEMLEVNEEMAEADLEDVSIKEELRKKLTDLKEEIYEPVQPIVENNKADLSEEELLRLKEYYLKKKYLKRLASQIGFKL